MSPNQPFETDLRKRASLACSAVQWRRYAAKRHWKMQLPLAVTELVEELRSDDSVMQVWLIGSQASGGASLESDWDLLVFSTREASVTSARNPKIDVLWKGPSESVLLEGKSESFIIKFSDFSWELVAVDKATYRGRRFLDLPDGARDASKQPQVMLTQSAVCLWSRERA
jgi:predicted nucleotidyltransferase